MFFQKIYRVNLAQSAIDDIDDIIDYLSKSSDNYAKLFIEEFYSYIVYLEDYPQLFIRIRKEFRRLYLKRFRYHVIFKIDEEEKIVQIIAVVHESRDPKKWIKS